jgi:hypothetical protein
LRMTAGKFRATDRNTFVMFQQRDVILSLHWIEAYLARLGASIQQYRRKDVGRRVEVHHRIRHKRN